MKQITIVFLSLLLMFTYGCSREDAEKVTDKAKEATTATKKAASETYDKAAEMTKEAASEAAGKATEMSK